MDVEPAITDSEPERVPGDEPLPPELQDAGEIDYRYIRDLWDALTHCAEPPGSKEVVKYFNEAIRKEDENEVKAVKSTQKEESYVNKMAEPTQGKNPNKAAKPVLSTWDKARFKSGRYQVNTNEKGKPGPRPNWPEEFQFHWGQEMVDGKPQDYFQAFKSEDDAKLILTEEKSSRDFAKFGRKYHVGPKAYDEEGKLKWKPYLQLEHYNYSEHALLGNNLRLRWSTDSVREGAEALNMENGNQLSYGQINALGGDFFATMTPICLGKTFEEQCDLFKKAYATLAEAKIGAKEAILIVDNRQHEVDTIQKAIDDNASTAQAYKTLEEPSKTLGGKVDKEVEDLTAITLGRDGPSYVRIALLNLDHFGEDARTAYNAGHTCAMRAAAAGDLELGYTMNAFADHFLGDCFASGHIRTPRRRLHGNDEDVQKAADFIIDMWKDKHELGISSSVTIPKAVRAAAPDFCSKFMHDEDNSLGLWVLNRRGDRWKAYGDKKLFEASNENNKKLMKECLQASADEVYQAYETRSVPGNPDEYIAWQIAPTTVDSGNHNPLFNASGHYRSNYEDPFGKTSYKDPRSYWKLPPWEGFLTLALKFRWSDYFKKFERSQR